MIARNTSLEEAQALGFASVEQCDEHERWLTERQAHFAAEKAYQSTPGAEARRLKAAEEAGCDPASIIWVSLSGPYCIIR